ncbi:hypothetical protein LCGC14_1709570 [marine sediment metagenome]|uniref:Uncharacterized protein n=1 Tax=marine sediment metagenome TaxID=412755 RepID=A0A0F9HG67_9ZZZZ
MDDKDILKRISTVYMKQRWRNNYENQSILCDGVAQAQLEDCERQMTIIREADLKEYAKLKRWYDRLVIGHEKTTKQRGELIDKVKGLEELMAGQKNTLK